MMQLTLISYAHVQKAIKSVELEPQLSRQVFSPLLSFKRAESQAEKAAFSNYVRYRK